MLLVANLNYEKIQLQIKIFKPKIIIINNLSVYLKIKKLNKLNKLIVLNNFFLIEKYIKKVDITVSAIPGIAGLEPTLTFIKLSKKNFISKQRIHCLWLEINKKRID